MIERKLYLLRMQATNIPPQGALADLDFPPLLTERLNAGAWKVVNHTLAMPDFTGEMVLSLYCERDA